MPPPPSTCRTHPTRTPDAGRRPMPTASVPHRPDRRPVVSARPAAARPALWPWPARPPRHQPPGADERDLVRAMDRLPMAGPARLLSPLAHRPPPLRPLGRRRHPGTAARGAARSGTRDRRPRGHADRRGDRLAVGPGQRLGLTATKGYDAAKKVHGRKRRVAVDTCGLLLDILVTPPAPRTATVAGGCCGAFVTTCRPSGWSGPTPSTPASWSSGRNRSSPWQSRSSASGPAYTTSRCCLAAGSWSGPSLGWASAAGSPLTTSASPNTTRHGCSGPWSA